MSGVAIIADSKGGGYEFARGVYKYLDARLTDVIFVDVEKTVFKDKEFKVKIAQNIRRKKCFLIHDSNKEPAEWFTELVFLLEAMSFSSPDEINIVLPYTKFARQDRKDESRVSVNAKALADVISLYADRGITCDLHSAQMQEYFDIPFDNLYSFPALIHFIENRHSDMLNDLVIVSPDLGGGKRAEILVKTLQKKGINVSVALGHKRRSRDNYVDEVTIIGEVEGKNCLIIDDIIDTGGTLIKTAQALKRKNAKKVLAYATHGLFSGGFMSFDGLDKMLVSDTLAVPPDERVETVSLVDLFGEAIYRTVVGKSLGVLFED
jgi:ribose-phosphate pyrophosphokinase